MRPHFFIVFYLVGFSSLFAQITKADYYNKIDNKIFTFSKEKPNAPFDTITSFVNANFQSQEDRARAYYTWIALNISYDVEHLDELNLMQMFNVNRATSTNQKPPEVLKNKKAVCEGYSNLMVDFCTASSIPCFLVCGYTKTPDGDIPEILHAWNVMRIDSVWTMVDITWSSGYIDFNHKYVKRFSNLYFMPKPKNFIKDHLPLDPMWQLLKNPFTKKDFENDSLLISHSPIFNFPDSIRAYRAQPIKRREYLNMLHHYWAEPNNQRHALNLDIANNNLIADELNNGVGYQMDFTELSKSKLSKKPTLSDCKKGKAILDSIQACSNRAQMILSKTTPYTPEYKEVFAKMQASITSNNEIIKTNYSYLNQMQAYLKKKK